MTFRNDDEGNGGAGGGGIQSCPECGKSFTNKSALAKHRLIHSNERKYACHLCDKSFKRQDHLNGHLQTHQERKPFVCKAPGCDKSYCDSRSLKRHVEGQHQDFLALLANGNSEALNYLPSIGKLKANVAPNVQHEIIVKKPDELLLPPYAATAAAAPSSMDAAGDESLSSLGGGGGNNESILPVVVNLVATTIASDEAGQGAKISGVKTKNFFTWVYFHSLVHITTIYTFINPSISGQ